MDRTAATILGICLVGAALIVVLIPRGSAPHGGRFQMMGESGHAFILDTATGRVWEKSVPAGSFSSTDRFCRIVVEQPTGRLLGDMADAEAAKSDQVGAKPRINRPAVEE